MLALVAPFVIKFAWAVAIIDAGASATGMK